MKVKMIVTDLDFTVLHSDRSVSEYTGEVFEECRSRGILTAVATARFYLGTREFLKVLKPDYAITNDGTMVYEKEKFLFGFPLGADRADLLVHRILEEDPKALLSVSVDHGVYRNYTRIDYATAPYAHLYTSFEEPLRENVYKVVAEPTKPELLETYAKEAGCRLFRYRDENRYAFLMPEAGKFPALLALCQRLGVKLEETAAFGDDINDLEMIEKCGLGVAVGNALPEIKEKADAEALSNDEDGVPRFIQEKILSGQKLLTKWF